ncbi:hypothetical protein PSYMO_38168, partial [Pseudomonas amygdali pv. mori str. 301020]
SRCAASSKVGRVGGEPFDQVQLNRYLSDILEDDD